MSSNLINFFYVEAEDLGELCQPSKVNRLTPIQEARSSAL